MKEDKPKSAVKIVRDADKKKGYTLRGDNRVALSCKEHEFILSGPADTGKTVACCIKAHLICRLIPGAQGAIVRETKTSLRSSVLNTFERVIKNQGVKTLGGENPSRYIYPNGSTIWLGGMDKPDKVLSSERDFIYCFIGDTLVESPSPILKAYRRTYSGRLVTIETASGNKLTGTPNHPILTDNGWVALGKLNVGDNAISNRFSQKSISGNPDINNRPTAIAEIFGAIAKSQTSLSKTDRIAGIEMDFHGDGRQTNVEIVTASGHFQNTNHATIFKPTPDSGIDRARFYLKTLKSLGAFFKIFFRLLFPARRIGSTRGEGFNPIGITPTPIMRRLAPRESRKPATFNLGNKGAVADSNAPTNRYEASFPFEITPDRIVHISSADCNSFHVFNLHTADNYYIANNIIVHNCNQAEELSLNSWEILGSRCSGRGAVIAVPQLFGDCNPGGSKHWIRERAKQGRLRLLVTTHKDNPTLYNVDGTMIDSEDVRRRMSVLDNMTGVRKLRLKEGIWATAEGAVYEMFNAERTGQKSDHVQVRTREEMQRFYMALDDGFTNPAVILDIGCDTDGRWHIFREFYKRGWVQDDVADVAKSWHIARRVDMAACDEAAAGLIEAMKRKGLPAVPGKGKIFDGIAKIQARLKVQKDGRPRLTIDPSCVETINEFESYVWKPEKDIPVDEWNHSLGALRYLSDALNEPTGSFESTEGIRVGTTSSAEQFEVETLTAADLGIDLGTI